MKFTYFKLYGERNTGTNYLRMLLDLNTNITMLPGTAPYSVRRMQQILPGHEWVKDLYFSVTESSNLGWKHSKVLSPDKLSRCKAMAQPVAFITLTKNPYSWLLSLHKRPHSYSASLKSLDFAEFIESPWITVRRENASQVIDNPVVLWNLKNRAYIDLKRNLPTCSLLYEDLVADPAQVVEDVVEQLTIDRSSPEFINVEQSTKGDERTYADYRRYYLEEHWKSLLSEQTIATINKYLDLELLDYYGYSKL